MSDGLEHLLRKMMVGLGHTVERVINKAKATRVQVGTRQGVQPILSLESQLPLNRMRDLIDASIQRVMANAIPDLRETSALEVGEGPSAYTARMLAFRAKAAVGVEIGGGSLGRQGDSSRGYVVRGQVGRLPFPDKGFGYFLARLATPFAGDMQRAVKELGRVLASGGQGVIVDYHPFGLYAKKGAHRVRPVDSGIGKLEDYYHVCREGKMRVIDVREAFVDEALRSAFREEEISAYRGIKGTPLLIFIFVYKPKGS